MKNWYIIQSHSSFENKVAQLIKAEADKANISNKKRLELEISEANFFCTAPTYKVVIIYFLILIGVFVTVILNNVPKHLENIILKNFEKYNHKNS